VKSSEEVVVLNAAVQQAAPRARAVVPSVAPQIREVLFPTDLSAPSTLAFDHARELAERFGARLTLYHVVETLRQESAPRPADTELEVLRRMEEAARDWLEARAKGLRVPVRIFVERRPSSARALLSFAEWSAPDLIVMATHGRHGLAHVFMGSVTENVLESARRPVLCIRPAAHGEPLPYRRILVPTDLSAASRRAFPLAALLARAYGAEVVVLHVAAYPAIASLSGVPELIEEVLPDEETVRRFVAPEFGKLPLAAKVAIGGACEQIVRTARVERADCIVMATRGHDSLHDRVLGTHAERVIRSAPCPVLAL
jgi:nucleotide-binding universal stress UspA family protein